MDKLITNTPLNLSIIRIYINIVKNVHQHFDDAYIDVYCAFLTKYIHNWRGQFKYLYNKNQRKNMERLLNDKILKVKLMEYLLKQ